jgi:hypothetical protein
MAGGLRAICWRVSLLPQDRWCQLNARGSMPRPARGRGRLAVVRLNLDGKRPRGCRLPRGRTRTGLDDAVRSVPFSGAPMAELRRAIETRTRPPTYQGTPVALSALRPNKHPDHKMGGWAVGVLASCPARPNAQHPEERLAAVRCYTPMGRYVHGVRLSPSWGTALVARQITYADQRR